VISVAENTEVNPMRYPNVLGIDLRWLPLAHPNPADAAGRIIYAE
jgi:hypothetical protein